MLGIYIYIYIQRERERERCILYIRSSSLITLHSVAVAVASLHYIQ